MINNKRFQKFWKQFSQNRGAVAGLVIIGLLIFLALFAPWLAPYSPTVLHDNALRLPPFWSEMGQLSYPLGTDDLGRDLLSRLIHGSRVSMAIGFSVVTLSLTSGTLLGMLAGFFGGWTDKVIMRFIDILMSLPSILLAIVVVAILGPGLMNAIIAVSIVAIPNFTRIVRASVMAEKEKEYVQASRSFGASPWRTLLKEVMPNCMAPLIVQASLGFSDGILNAAALGFLGLGAQPPTPEWGIMLSDARIFISTSPWMVTLPGLLILFSVLGFNLLGDGLRDALDPRLKGK
jgi:peptide/nickel transport system permease protein/dipeptide transport system permease protein